MHKKMKLSIKDSFSKCDQIRSFLRIWSHLLKKFLMENFIFCAQSKHLNKMSTQTNLPRVWPRYYMSSQKRNHLQVKPVPLWTDKECPILYHILFVTASKDAILNVYKYYLFCFFQLIIFSDIT